MRLIIGSARRARRFCGTVAQPMPRARDGDRDAEGRLTARPRRRGPSVPAEDRRDVDDLRAGANAASTTPAIDDAEPAGEEPPHHALLGRACRGRRPPGRRGRPGPWQSVVAVGTAANTAPRPHSPTTACDGERGEREAALDGEPARSFATLSPPAATTWATDGEAREEGRRAHGDGEARIGISRASGRMRPRATRRERQGRRVDALG